MSTKSETKPAAAKAGGPNADPAKSDGAKQAAAAPPPHHVRARIFAMKHFNRMRVAPSNLLFETDRLVSGYLLKGAPNAETVDARITAIEVASSGQIIASALVDHARPIEQYLLTGKAPRQPTQVGAAVPAAAGEAPADNSTSRESQVPDPSGEAGADDPMSRFTPSKRHGGHEV